MNLSKTLFWDCDFSKIDWDKSYSFVIQRVLERGTLDEWFDIKKHYGMEKIKETVLNARYLNKKVLSFCSTIFDVPKEDFRCYKLQQLNPGHWEF